MMLGNRKVAKYRWLVWMATTIIIQSSLGLSITSCPSHFHRITRHGGASPYSKGSVSKQVASTHSYCIQRRFLWRLRVSEHSSTDEEPKFSVPSGASTVTSTKTTSTKSSWSAIMNASLLIAGTTVGGGFLALPTVVAPTGFVPSAAALMGVWAFFLAQSYLLVECLIRTRIINKQRTASSSSHSGIAAAAYAAFGPLGESIAVLLLVVSTKATLVSQIARAGSLFSGALSYRLGCAVTSLSTAALVFRTGSSADEDQQNNLTALVNSILTSLFVIVAVALFLTGAPAANWARLRPSMGGYASWAGLPLAIPTFLQLLVYGEILPTVCQFLNYQTNPIRLAILVGSMLPLALEIGWAGLGLGLVESRPSSALIVDPVQILLSTGTVQTPLLILAITAIMTTIIGSYLALQSTYEDIFPEQQSLTISKNHNTTSGHNGNDIDTNKSSHQERLRRAILMASSITLPSLAIASVSPDLFLSAIDFAGSYPVLLLFGLGPPACLWKLRQQKLSSNSNADATLAPLSKWFVATLVLISLGLFAMSAVPDAMALFQTMKAVFM